jgi:hypothetical protein
MGQKIVSLTELARIITATTGETFTRQACHKAAGEGLFPIITQGKKKLVDLADPAVRLYIGQDNRQREQAKKKDERANMKDKKQAKPAGASKLQKHKSVNPIDPSELDPYVIKQRAMVADMRKKEAQAKIIEKNYLPREFIEDGLFRYLEKLNTVIERSASVYIAEVGQKILEAGEVQPVHIERFISLVLQSIHDTKKKVIKEIEKYEPRL